MADSLAKLLENDVDAKIAALIAERDALKAKVAEQRIFAVADEAVFHLMEKSEILAETVLVERTMTRKIDELARDFLASLKSLLDVNANLSA